MLINVSELLSNDGEFKTYSAHLDMEIFKSSMGEFPIVKCDDFSINVLNEGNRKLKVDAAGSLVLDIPCDRCLKSVETDIEFTIDCVINMDLSDSEGIEVEDQDFVDGYNLDIDKMIYPEILINFPDKTLCKEDCLGLCLVCGHDLNESECGCDRRSLDPRMSVIQDIFNNRKEV